MSSTTNVEKKNSIKIKRTKENSPIWLTTTSYDSQEQLREMYKPFIEYNIKKLQDNHVNLFYGIDATKLDSNQLISQLDPTGHKFDRIVWNFPHSGFPEKGDG